MEVRNLVWNNKTKVFEIDSEIIEWDIKSANISICREYGLLTEKQLSQIESMPKDKRVRTVGLLERSSKKFAKALEEHFDVAVNQFMDQNGVSKDQDVICIKKDAVFVINKNIVKPNIGEAIHFIRKNTYDSFLRLDRFEFYINNDTVDVKGLQEQQHLHEDGICHLIKDVVRTASECKMNSSIMNEYLSEMVNLYKNHELAIEYYREFNSTSAYRVIDTDDNEFLFNDISEEYLDEKGYKLDISYNYINIILPLIRMLR